MTINSIGSSATVRRSAGTARYPESVGSPRRGLLAQVKPVLAGWAHDLQTLTRRMVSPEIGLLELLVPAARYGVQ
jgi:hypothetical protein